MQFSFPVAVTVVLCCSVNLASVADGDQYPFGHYVPQTSVFGGTAHRFEKEGHPVTAIAFSQSAELLAVGFGAKGQFEHPSVYFREGKGHPGVHIWSISNKAKAVDFQLKGFRGCVTDITVSRDGKMFAVSSAHWVSIWRSGDRNVIKAISIKWLGKAVEFSSSGNKIIVGSCKTKLYTIDGPMPLTLASYEIPSGNAGGGKSRGIPEMTSQQSLGKEVAMFTDDIVAMSLSPDGQVLAIGVNPHDDAKFTRPYVMLLNLKNGRKSTYLVRDRGTGIRAICFCDHGKYVAIGLARQQKAKRGSKPGPTLVLMDSKTARTVWQVSEHNDGVLSIAFSPAHKVIATAGADGAVRICALRNGRQVSKRKLNRGSVNCVAFSRKGDLLAAGCADGSVFLWRR